MSGLFRREIGNCESDIIGQEESGGLVWYGRNFKNIEKGLFVNTIEEAKMFRQQLDLFILLKERDERK